MGMEQRQSVRHSTNLPIALYLEDLGLMCGRVRDLSEGGTCVTIGRGILPLHVSVEVVITLHGESHAQQCWRAKGMVVYCHEDMTGIRFESPIANMQFILAHQRSQVLH